MQLIPYDNSVKVSNTGQKPVLVFTDKENSMGIIVDKILDIVEDRIDVHLPLLHIQNLNPLLYAVLLS
jgi:two-component system chemotaxis sensor kinase CheA